jgi:hypothetical protein
MARRARVQAAGQRSIVATMRRLWRRAARLNAPKADVAQSHSTCALVSAVYPQLCRHRAWHADCTS